MIAVNTYLDGKVKSLGFDRDGVKYTAGVLIPGGYAFNTEQEEHITVTLGPIEFKLPAGDWEERRAGESIVIPPSVTFEVRAKAAASYICEYK